MAAKNQLIVEEETSVAFFPQVLSIIMSPSDKMQAPTSERTTPTICPLVITCFRKREESRTWIEAFVLKIEIATPARPIEIEKLTMTRDAKASTPAIIIKKKLSPVIS